MLNDKKRVNLLCEKMLNFANNNRKKQYIYEKNYCCPIKIGID